VPWHSGAAQRSGAAALVGTEQRAKERMAKGREVEREREYNGAGRWRGERGTCFPRSDTGDKDRACGVRGGRLKPGRGRTVGGGGQRGWW
jgi:hypothetical protein